MFGGGGASTNKRYNLTLSVYARNVFNYTNANTPTGVLNPPIPSCQVANPAPSCLAASPSPFFATPNTLAGGPYSTNGASRLIYLQIGLTF